MSNSIAVDIGANSGRVIKGNLRDGKIALKEIYRFPNEISFVNGHYRWKINYLFREICEGLKKSADRGLIINSIGVDTWGVDYALLDEKNRLIELPISYRDNRTDDMMDRFFNLMPKEEIYQITGIQFMQLNTIFQLYAASLDDPEILKKTRYFLMIPDYLNFKLTSRLKTEYTIATTSQLLNIETSNWDDTIIDLLTIDRSLFSKPVPPGTCLGEINSEVRHFTGLREIPVILPPSHDTASAIAAVPALKSNNWAYISSGTWSLMGIEVDRPILSQKALDANFTNEGGVDNTFRFLKNIMGLWPIQELQREHTVSYDIEEIIAMAEKVSPFASLIDPDDPVFLAPGNMAARIKDYCRKTKQPVPDSMAQLARCIFDSLALQYRWVLNKLNDISQQKIDCIHIVGGGSQNQLLNQLCADVTGCEVKAGPAEVTSLGNILMQCISRGEIASIAEGRQIIQQSFDIKKHHPNAIPDLDGIYEQFSSLKQGAH